MSRKLLAAPAGGGHDSRCGEGSCNDSGHLASSQRVGTLLTNSVKLRGIGAATWKVEAPGPALVWPQDFGHLFHPFPRGGQGWGTTQHLRERSLSFLTKGSRR